MKIKFLLLLVFIFSIVTIIPLTNSASAQNNAEKPQKIVILSKGETVDEDYFASGDRVEILGNVNSDVFVAGGQIIIEGNVNGDVFAAGGTIEISGNVSQNIYVAGGQINIDGKIDGDLTTAGGNISLSNTAGVRGDVNAMGGNISILSPVGSDIRVGGGSVNLASTVGGDVLAGVGTIRLSNGAIIQKGLTYSSDEQVSISQDASVAGKINYIKPVRRVDVEKASGFFEGVNVVFTIISLISTIIFGVLFIWLLPNFSQRTAEIVKSKFWLSLLIGFITLIITPILAVILLVTFIGIPIGLFLLFAYAVIIYISKIFVALTVGEYINKTVKWKLTPIWTFVVGISLYYIVGIIPVIGGLMKFMVLLVGIGAIVIQEKYYITTLRDKKLL